MKLFYVKNVLICVIFIYSSIFFMFFFLTFYITLEFVVYFLSRLLLLFGREVLFGIIYPQIPSAEECDIKAVK